MAYTTGLKQKLLIMNTSRLGNIGEAKVLWEFVKKQIPIYTQFGDTESADIIAQFNGRLNKIQCKTSDSLKDNKVTWTLTTTTYTGDGYKKECYTKEEVDYFALYSNQLDILLLVPIEDILNKTSITVSVPYKKSTNQYIALNYEDYLFEKVIGESNLQGVEAAC